MEDSAFNLRSLSDRDLVMPQNGGAPVPVTPFRTFDFGDCLDPFVSACSDPVPLANAFGMMEALAQKTKFRTSGAAKALYVLGIDGDDDASKIGVSANAIKRLAEIQAAHYRRLYLHAVAFFPKHNAVKVEQGVLRAAAARGDRCCGEWVRSDADSLFREALEFAKVKSVPILDARTWFEDMRVRTIELARGQKFRRAA